MSRPDNQIDPLTVPYARCLCDDCCRQCPDRLLERNEQHDMARRKLKVLGKRPTRTASGRWGKA